MAKSFRPRKATYAELQTRCDSLDRANGVFLVALQCVACERPDATAKAAEPAPCQYGRYRFDAYRVNRAHGGILVTTFTAPGQSPSIRAEYLEDVFARFRELPSWMLTALGPLQTAVRFVQQTREGAR